MVSDRERAILDAACYVISEIGIAYLRVEDVAEKAGVSRALVHYYFPGRAELIERAFTHSDERSRAVGEAQLQDVRTGRGRVEKLLAVWASDDPAIRVDWLVWNEMWQYAAHNERGRALVESVHGRWLQQIHDLIAEGVVDGSIPNTVDVGAAARRLAACADEWGREARLGLRSASEMRGDLDAAVEHELGAAKTRKRSAA